MNKRIILAATAKCAKNVRQKFCVLRRRTQPCRRKARTTTKTHEIYADRICASCCSGEYIILSALTVLIAAAGIIVWLIMQNAPRSDPAAEIYLNGELIRTVSLSEECVFTIDCESGYNTVSVRDGAIAVTDADCPDKVCMHTGAISGGAVPIVCLPHRLEIRIVDGEDSVDAAI